MARTYNSAGRHEFTVPVGFSPPISIACWFNPANITGSYNAITLGVAGASDQGRLQLNLMGSIAGDYVAAVTRNSTGGTTLTANTTTGYSANTWQHACAVFASAASRAAYLNGGSKGTETTFQGIGTLTLGMFGGAVTTTAVRSNNYVGALAEIAMWNVALTDDEVATLASGASPSTVQPGSLRGYWPLFDSDGDVDYWNQNNATVVSSVTSSQHPANVYHPMGISIYQNLIPFSRFFPVRSSMRAMLRR